MSFFFYQVLILLEPIQVVITMDKTRASRYSHCPIVYYAMWENSKESREKDDNFS
jgi:hypothetical protein